MNRAPRPDGVRNTVRIIGGRWRGRRIRFPDSEGLRPTPDRLRETLFNWLMHDVRDARVLDLFAGSGALGFEALSRGAREAVLVDNSPAVCAQLARELAALEGAAGRVVRADARDFLRQPPATPFDLVFLDPPYAQAAALLPAIASALEADGFLAGEARVYVESPQPPAGLPAHWHLHRQQQAGQACCSLYVRVPSA